MRTLLFTLEYPPFKGGIANYYENLVKYWPEPANIFVLHNNDQKLIKNWLWPKWILAFYYLYKEIKKNKIENVLVGHILPLGTVAYYLSKFIKFKYSIILHGMDIAYAQKKFRKKILTEKILKNSKNIICVNSYTAELVKEILSGKQINKTVVVNPGIFKQQTTNNKQQINLIKKYDLENKIILFSIGRLVKRKGFDKVIEVMLEVLKKVPNLIYVIAGTGPDEEYLKKKAGSEALVAPPATTIFLGKIKEEEKWSWFGLCDIFIMPARNIEGDFEGFGIVYLEANLVGKPVIAGDSGGVRDAVKNKVNGFLVNPENKSEISKAIIKLAIDKNLRSKLGNKGRERALERFTWEKQVKKIYNCVTHNA